ncbi:MAG: T9SS type A sorting domain-containing protein [Chitinophagaceae bacterium]
MKSFFYILFIAVLLLPFCLVAQGLIIPSGAYVVASNGNIVVNRNWVNNGSFTHNGGTVIFAGTTQTLAGSTATTFNNLTTATGSTTTISSSGHKLKNILLSNGTLYANGNLTLLSTAAQTAAVDGSGSGNVLGNLIMQRYIASGFGYKYFSSPFQNDTVGDFSNDINLNASFPNFYRHDENQLSNGWINYTNGSGVLSPMHGYAANLGASTAAATVDLKGIVNNNTVSLNLYNHNMAYTQGFNLVGNPYPSPVNWDAASGWTKTNIDNAVYYFNAGTADQYTGVYSSYINGVSSDGVAVGTIAAMQGFFVHVSNGSYPVAGLLSVNNNARIINSTAHFFRVGDVQDNQSLLRINAGLADQTNIADPLAIYFNDAAGGKFNRQLDALKLMNTDSLIPNLYAVSTDAKKLSIQALASSDDTLTVVPLGLATKKDGWISFKAIDIKDIPASLYIYLTDIGTGTNHDLRKDPVYRLHLVSGTYEKRFFLKFSSRALAVNNTTADADIKIYSAGGRLFVTADLAAGEKGNVTVTNMLGQVVWRQEISTNISGPMGAGFASGVYIVNFSSPATNFSKKIFLGGH